MSGGAGTGGAPGSGDPARGPGQAAGGTARQPGHAGGPPRRKAGLVSWARHWYGANPLHLLALIAAFALAGYAVHAVVAAGQWRGFVEWFAVAIIAHDLLLFPLYSLADLSLRGLLPRWAVRNPVTAGDGGRPRAAVARPAPGPPVLNYIRIPVMFSLLLLGVFFPLILGLSQGYYHRASGLGTQPYLWRWLAITGVLFAGSAVCYAWRWRRATGQARKLARPTRPARPAPPAAPRRPPRAVP